MIQFYHYFGLLAIYFFTCYCKILIVSLYHSLPSNNVIPFHLFSGLLHKKSTNPDVLSGSISFSWRSLFNISYNSLVLAMKYCFNYFVEEGYKILGWQFLSTVFPSPYLLGYVSRPPVDADSMKHRIYYVFSYTYIFMVKFNL